MSRARDRADGQDLTAYAPLASPAFSGTPTGITAAHITSGVLPVGVTGGSGLTALASNPTVTLGSNATFPSGHVIQTKGDSFSKESVLYVETSSEMLLGTDLEVAMTCASTSNYLRVSLFLPNFYNRDATAGRSLQVGFRYALDSAPTSWIDLGFEWIDTYIGKATGTIFMSSVFVETWVAVPSIAALKIQVATKSIVGQVAIFTNASSTLQTASLIVQEIQT